MPRDAFDVQRDLKRFLYNHHPSASRSRSNYRQPNDELAMWLYENRAKLVELLSDRLVPAA